MSTNSRSSALSARSSCFFVIAIFDLLEGRTSLPIKVARVYPSACQSSATPDTAITMSSMYWKAATLRRSTIRRAR